MDGLASLPSCCSRGGRYPGGCLQSCPVVCGRWQPCWAVPVHESGWESFGRMALAGWVSVRFACVCVIERVRELVNESAWRLLSAGGSGGRVRTSTKQTTCVTAGSRAERAGWMSGAPLRRIFLRRNGNCQTCCCCCHVAQLCAAARALASQSSAYVNRPHHHLLAFGSEKHQELEKENRLDQTRKKERRLLSATTCLYFIALDSLYSPSSERRVDLPRVHRILYCLPCCMCVRRILLSISTERAVALGTREFAAGFGTQAPAAPAESKGKAGATFAHSHKRSAGKKNTCAREREERGRRTRTTAVCLSPYLSLPQSVRHPAASKPHERPRPQQQIQSHALRELLGPARKRSIVQRAHEEARRVGI